MAAKKFAAANHFSTSEHSSSFEIHRLWYYWLWENPITSNFPTKCYSLNLSLIGLTSTRSAAAILHTATLSAEGLKLKRREIRAKFMHFNSSFKLSQSFPLFQRPKGKEAMRLGSGLSQDVKNMLSHGLQRLGSGLLLDPAAAPFLSAGKVTIMEAPELSHFLTSRCLRSMQIEYSERTMCCSTIFMDSINGVSSCLPIPLDFLLPYYPVWSTGELLPCNLSACHGFIRHSHCFSSTTCIWGLNWRKLDISIPTVQKTACEITMPLSRA